MNNPYMTGTRPSVLPPGYPSLPFPEVSTVTQRGAGVKRKRRRDDDDDDSDDDDDDDDNSDEDSETSSGDKDDNDDSDDDDKDARHPRKRVQIDTQATRTLTTPTRGGGVKRKRDIDKDDDDDDNDDSSETDDTARHPRKRVRFNPRTAVLSTTALSSPSSSRTPANVRANAFLGCQFDQLPGFSVFKNVTIKLNNESISNSNGLYPIYSVAFLTMWFQVNISYRVKHR